jgi:starvation-inducible DNA-binding protein
MFATTTRFKTRHDLTEVVRQGMIALLNQHLADLSDLYSQTKQAHWNVRGVHFMQLHKLFDKLAGAQPDYIDMLAERANALGGYALGTVRMAADNSRLPEIQTDITSGEAMLEALANRYAAYAKSVREAIDAAQEVGDMDTADLFTGLSRLIDQQLWFIEAHLQ